MAKTYIDTVKYIIHSSVNIGGLVEKPDVVGAVFGQTEGLLGDDLDLRELQKNGRIGRIEVELATKEGRTTGTIKIPSSLDMVETCIVAAALEVVDRVGPCDALFRVAKVEDTRNLKRKVLVDRAKGLLKTLLNTEIPESKEISDMVRQDVKTAEITEYGSEGLPAGPHIEKFDEIIVVEGRADVINLLKNDIPNVIAIEGAKVPQTVVKLSKEKELSVFLDGDRGGDIILNELVQGGVEIDYIARAPPGKEVEELTRKELIKCIRGRIPFEQGGNSSSKQGRYSSEYQETRIIESEMKRKQHLSRKVDENTVARPFIPTEFKEQHEEIVKDIQQLKQTTITPITEEQVIAPPKRDKESLAKELNELNNTLKARFYNANYERIKEVQVRDVIKALDEMQNVEAIIFDGIITQRLVDLAASKNVKLLMGVKIGNVSKTPEGIEIVTKTK